LKAEDEFQYYAPLAKVLRILEKYRGYEPRYAIRSFCLPQELVSHFRRNIEVDVLLVAEREEPPGQIRTYLIVAEVKRDRRKVMEGLGKAILYSLFSEFVYLILCEGAADLADLLSKYICPKLGIGLIKFESLEELHEVLNLANKDERRAISRLLGVHSVYPPHLQDVHLWFKDCILRYISKKLDDFEKAQMLTVFHNNR